MSLAFMFKVKESKNANVDDEKKENTQKQLPAKNVVGPSSPTKTVEQKSSTEKKSDQAGKSQQDVQSDATAKRDDTSKKDDNVPPSKAQDDTDQTKDASPPKKSPEKVDRSKGSPPKSKSAVSAKGDDTSRIGDNLSPSKIQDDTDQDMDQTEDSTVHQQTESPKKNDNNKKKNLNESGDNINGAEPSEREQNHSHPGENGDNSNESIESIASISSIPSEPSDPIMHSTQRSHSSHSSKSSYGPDPLTIIHPDDTVAHVADGTPQVQRLPKRTSNRKMPGEHVRRKTPRRQNALNEIKYLQNSVNLLIPRQPFQRLVREILQGHKQNGFRTQAVALAALHEAAEMFLVDLFTDAMELAAHRSRRTLGQKDYRMAKYILKKFNKIP